MNNFSEQTRQKIRNSKIGHLVSFDTRKKISDTLKKKGIVPPSHKGIKASEKTKLKMSIARRGKRKSEDFRKKISGINHPAWKGGIISINEKIRKSLEYKLWRRAVFERDKYTCVWCKQKGGNLNADHIKPFALFPELRFALDNGRTLCIECHKRTDTWGGRTTYK